MFLMTVAWRKEFQKKQFKGSVRFKTTKNSSGGKEKTSISPHPLPKQSKFKNSKWEAQ